jgi:hypothetical protein
MFLEQVKTDNRFGFKFKACPVPPPESQSATVSEAVQPLVVETTDKPVDNEDRPDSAVDVTLDSDKPSEETSVPVRNSVRFHEAPVKPLLFHREAFVTDLKSPLVKEEDSWVPIKLGKTYGGTAQATGFKTMFAQTSLHTIGLKRRVLARFKAVQEYEKRRKQDALEACQTPDLGQLEYGNTDFKLALQPTETITANDIGTYVDSSDLGIPGNTGPLLHFGGFEDERGRSLEDARLPTATAAAEKPPLEWVYDLALHKFVVSPLDDM